MCVDPMSATVIGATLLSAVGTVIQTQGQVSTDRYNAQVTRQEGYSNELLQRDQDRRQMAKQVAVLSTRGAAIDTGSPLALQAESARNAELDALQIRTNALNKGASYDYQASAAQQAMPFTVAGQLLGGASKLQSLGQLGGPSAKGTV